VEELADFEELNYLCNLKQNQRPTSNLLASGFMGKGHMGEGTEVEKLREENKKLKRSFLDRFN
jgi:hypothetical protein